MRTDLSGVTGEIRTRASNVGLSIVYETDVEMPRTDGKTIYLPKPQPHWSEQEWVIWWYLFEHELGHNDPVMIDVFLLLREKKLKQGCFIGFVLNLLDDRRQEWHDYYVYEGRRQRLNEGCALFTSTKMGYDQYGQAGADVHRQAAECLFVWDTIERESWMPAVIGTGGKMVPYLNEQQLIWLERLLEGDYDSTLRSNTCDAWQEYDLVLRILSEVFEFDAEQEEQDAKSEAEGQSQDGDTGDGEGDAGSKEGSSEGEEGEGKEEGAGGATEVDYSDLLIHSHEPDQDGGNYTDQGLHINYDSHTQKFDACDPDKYEIIDFTKDAAIVEGGRYSQYKRSIGELTRETSIAKKVRRLLQTRMNTRYQHGLKRGKISPKSIYRGGMRNSGQVQRKVFKRKREVLELDVAITVLMDCSGSMSGQKYNHAAASTVMLNEALGSLNMPVEILGFDDPGPCPRMAVWKTFNKSVTKEVLIDRIADSYHRLMDANSDGESIMWANERLLKQKAKRHLLIVLSDGSPATWRGDGDWYTDKVIRAIDAQGLTETYGIGIMDRNVERLYRKHQVINHADELETAVLNVIKQKVINS